MSLKDAWQVLRSRPLYDKTFLRVREDRVRLSNGHEIDDFCVIESPPWVAVLCLTPAGEVVLVRQYRHGIRRFTYELPAGAMESGEEPLAAAQRELREETGFEAREWIELSTLAVDPSRHTALAHFFVARGAKQSAPPTPEPSEQIELRRVPARELLESVVRPRTVAAERPHIEHGMHVAAILLAQTLDLLGTTKHE